MAKNLCRKFYIKSYLVRMIGKCLISFVIFLFAISSFKTYAENLNIGFRYGINNVAKAGSVLPVELTIDNRDSQRFTGHLDLNIYESNDSVYKYRTDVSIEPRESITRKLDITLASSVNTLIIEVYNKREEVVSSERTNVDLSAYNDTLLVGAISNDFNSLSYINDLILVEDELEVKILDLSKEKISSLGTALDIVDVLLISDYSFNDMSLDDKVALQNFAEAGKSIILSGSITNNLTFLPEFIFDKYNEGIIIDDFANGTYARFIRVDNLQILFLPWSFNSISNYRDNKAIALSVFEKGIESEYLKKVASSYDSALNNDYYNVGELLNIIYKQKLPDIFFITVLLVIYLFILTILIYVYLRNSNKRKYYGRYAFVFSVLATILMFYLGFSIMKRNVFLTYISIVDIKDANAKERAFLNFRTSEGGDYSFDTSDINGLYPLIKNQREPIKSVNFIDTNSIKTTTFLNIDDRKSVTVENAKDFDSNIFVYENSNYLNDIYSIASSFQRFDGLVTGRITNNMSLPIRNAHLLLHGKVLRIGDIEANHSISLSRATAIGAPINNNEMLADIISTDANHNIVKYYLDENIKGFYDDGVLFGFIDNNGTIDINSKDVGDVYGRTMIVTRINDDKTIGIADYSSLQNEVSNLEGYYEVDTNTIRGDEEVTNIYRFSKDALVSKIYFEGIDNYDYGSIDSFVPFYGEIYAFNLVSKNFDLISDGRITFDSLRFYLNDDNELILRFNPVTRDPLYRNTSLPVIRAIASY